MTASALHNNVRVRSLQNSNNDENIDGIIALVIMMLFIFCAAWAPSYVRRCRGTPPPSDASDDYVERLAALMDMPGQERGEWLRRMMVYNNWAVISRFGMTPEDRKEYISNCLMTKHIILVGNEKVAPPLRIDPASGKPVLMHEKSDVLLPVPNSKKRGKVNDKVDDDDDTDDVGVDDDDDNNSRTSSALDNVCAICLTEYENGDEISWSHNKRCNHFFHRACIAEWLISHDECPCCRVNFLSFDDEEDEDDEHSWEERNDDDDDDSDDDSENRTDPLSIPMRRIAHNNDDGVSDDSDSMTNNTAYHRGLQLFRHFSNTSSVQLLRPGAAEAPPSSSLSVNRNGRRRRSEQSDLAENDSVDAIHIPLPVGNSNDNNNSNNVSEDRHDHDIESDTQLDSATKDNKNDNVSEDHCEIANGSEMHAERKKDEIDNAPEDNRDIPNKKEMHSESEKGEEEDDVVSEHCNDIEHHDNRVAKNTDVESPLSARDSQAIPDIL